MRYCKSVRFIRELYDELYSGEKIHLCLRTAWWSWLLRESHLLQLFG